MTARTRSFVVAVALLGLATRGWAIPGPDGPPASSSGAAREEADDDERAYRDELARRSLNNNCLICHGDEMIGQQRLTPKQWTAEVEKMVGWGAPLPREEAPALIDYLARSYRADASPFAPPRLPPDQVLPRGSAASPSRAGDRARGAEIFAAHCATCHGKDARGGDLGSNLVEIPLLLQGGDFVKLAREGRHRMPGFRLVVDDARLGDILAWLRRL